MKKIAILTCLEAVGSVCTGAGCFSALNERKGNFSRYAQEEIQLQAFFQCNGCQSDSLKDKGMQEKLQRIIGLKPDAVHIGVCTKTKTGEQCENIKKIVEQLKANEILCIEGTHS